MKKYIWGSIILALIIWLGIGLDQRLKVVHYTIKNIKIKEPVTIAFAADLHSCNYGENQERLFQAIDQSAPDLLLLGGDIIDDDMPEKKAIEFLSIAGKKYETYYVTGNHEYWTNRVPQLKNMIREYNIKVLEGESKKITVRGQDLAICGIDDKEIKNPVWTNQLNHANSMKDSSLFSILLTHRPEEFKTYLSYEFDLALAGHAHGGQWRIPYLINGVLAPNQGLFPKYAGGKYEEDHMTMIVSRGLARESTRIPRFYNRPELVIITLLPESKQ